MPAGANLLIALLILLPCLRGEEVIRFAFTANAVGNEYNTNDLRAALKTWSDALGREVDIRVDYGGLLLASPDKLYEAVRTQQVDGVTLTPLDYSRVADYVDSDSLIVAENDFNLGEEYVLLVYDESALRSLDDLRGRTLLQHSSSRNCLAPIWLATALAGAKLGAPENFFGNIVSNPKLARVVLPVYFRQSDACLVTRRGFATMCDLNPQLGRRLRVLAASPKLVPVFMGLQRSCPPERRQLFLKAILNLHQSVAGKQILALFQTGRLMTARSSILRTSLDLVAAYDRIRPRSSPRK